MKGLKPKSISINKFFKLNKVVDSSNVSNDILPICGGNCFDCSLIGSEHCSGK